MSSKASSPKPQPKPYDPVPRGEKGPSPGTRTLFVTLRTLTPLLHYLLLATPVLPHLLTSLGLRTISIATPLVPAAQLSANLATTLCSLSVSSLSPAAFAATLSSVGLSPPRFLLLLGTVLTSTKHIHWATSLSAERVPVASALGIPLGTMFFAFVEALLYFWRPTSPASVVGESVTAPVAFGAVLVALGLGVEWLSELQRAAFKAELRNKGMLFTGGLFRVVRHVNYAGFILWRAGEMFMGGGWIAGLVVAGLAGWDLGGRAVSLLDEYCGRRYGDQWTKYKRDVPHRIVPGVW